jgi:Flp pilus assembly protein TadD
MKKKQIINLFAAILLPCQSIEILEKKVSTVSEPLYVEVFRELNSLWSRLMAQKTTSSIPALWQPEDQSCLEKTEQMQKVLKESSLVVPDEKGYLNVQAQYLIQRSLNAEAEKLLQRVLKMHPTSVEANYFLAQIYKMNKSKISDREKHLKRVLVEKSVQPFEADLQIDVLRQLIMEFSFDPLETQKYLDLWTQKAPSAPELWLKRAEISHQLKDAVKLEETLSHLTGEAQNYYGAKAAMLRGSFDIAEEKATNFINANSDRKKDLEIRKWLVERLILRGVVQSARTLAEKSLLQYPNEPELLKAFVKAVMTGAFDKENSIKDLESALITAPDAYELSFKLLDELLKNSRPSSPVEPMPDKAQIKQAEGLIRRLDSMKNLQRQDQLYVTIWKMNILFGKRIFTDADAMFNRAEQVVLASKKDLFPESSLLKEYDFWILGSKIKKSRGLFQESKDLIQRGLSRAKTQEDRQNLLKALSG